MSVGGPQVPDLTCSFKPWTDSFLPSYFLFLVFFFPISFSNIELRTRRSALSISVESRHPLYANRNWHDNGYNVRPLGRPLLRGITTATRGRYATHGSSNVPQRRTTRASSLQRYHFLFTLEIIVFPLQLMSREIPRTRDKYRRKET